MFSRLLLIALALGLTANAGAAQLYRWVDGKGNVEWRDTPPPASVPQKQIEQRRVGGSVISTSQTPFSVQLAAKNHPVTFWASSDCGKACDDARALLGKRGVPYTESSPRADPEGFKKVSPGNEVPILQVGATTVKGYLDSEWNGALDNAGYPRSAPAAKPTVIQPKPAAEPPKPTTADATPAAAPAPPPSPAAPATVPAIR